MRRKRRKRKITTISKQYPVLCTVPSTVGKRKDGDKEEEEEEEDDDKEEEEDDEKEEEEEEDNNHLKTVPHYYIKY